MTALTASIAGGGAPTRGFLALLALAVLAACGPMTAAPSCSSDPEHEKDYRIDFTAGQTASQVFQDPRAATLARAVASDSPGEVKALLQQGADPNARGEKGLTMLGWAMRRNGRNAFAVLLDAGADATVPEHTPSATPDMDNGRTVVHYAAMTDDPAYLQILLAHHVSPDLRTIAGNVPMVDSILSRCDKRIERLIEARANVNAADEMGDTLLHVAAQINAFDTVMDLLNAGANPNARNHIGKSFQAYLRMTPDKLLTQRARASLALIDAWLARHNVPLEQGPR